MSSEKVPGDFEAWFQANKHFMLGTRKVSKGDCFFIWQASREALVVELPEPYAVIGDYAACGGGRSVWDSKFAEKITDRMCEKTPVYDRAGLISAGLKVSS